MILDKIVKRLGVYVYFFSIVPLCIFTSFLFNKLGFPEFLILGINRILVLWQIFNIYLLIRYNRYLNSLE
jgi:hypothetical protein